MNSFLFYFILVPVIVIALLALNLFFAQSKPNEEKLSTFECGFSPVEQARQKFSVHFYLVGILFLVFDLEVLLLFPAAVSMNSIAQSGFWVLLFFLVVLTVGFIYEYASGALNYAKKDKGSEHPPCNNSSSLKDNSISNGITNKLGVRNFSISTRSTNLSTNNTKELDPYFVTGFIDAEGCFSIKIRKSNFHKLGWSIQATFSIFLHSKDLSLLLKIQEFFKGKGKVYIRSNKNLVGYEVHDIPSICNIIIPHLDKYSLCSAKSVDFLLFKKCALLIKNKEHLTRSGLERIISIKAALNLGNSELIVNSFPNLIPIERPPYLISEDKLDPHWVTGFTEGDGCFGFYLGPKQTYAYYQIHLNKRDDPLLMKIKNFFNSKGSLSSHEKDSTVIYRVIGTSDLNNLIIPHFDKFDMSGVKSHNYIIWKDMVLLLANKAHLTPEGQVKLIELKSILNKI